VSPEQHPAATGRGPAADSGRLLCGKKLDGPTEGRLPAPSVGAPIRGAPCGPGVWSSGWPSKSAASPQPAWRGASRLQRWWR